MALVIHTLVSGATVVSLSKHGFKFSDGTVSAAQSDDVVSLFTLRREQTPCAPIKGMKVNGIKMILSPDQIVSLREICSQADVVIVPFPVLTALREQGIRDQFPNAVAFNATLETQRAASPADKVVDIDNWSY